MRIRLAPIRQGEGVSRTISGDSKGQRVLWRVFLHTLSSRKERVCPRRALPTEKRFVSLGVATSFAPPLMTPCPSGIPLSGGTYGGAHTASPIGVPAEAQPVRRVRWGKEEMRSDRAFAPQGKTRDTEPSTTREVAKSGVLPEGFPPLPPFRRIVNFSLNCTIIRICPFHSPCRCAMIMVWKQCFHAHNVQRS